MAFDFNAPAASAFNAGKESPVRNAMVRDGFDGTFTIRFWYKPTNLNYLGVAVGTTNGRNQIIQRRRDPFAFLDDRDYWEIFSNSPSTSPNEIVMRARSGGSTYDRTGTVTVNQWNHIVAGYVRQTATGSGHIFMEVNNNRNFVETPPLDPMPLADSYEFGLHPPGVRLVNQAFTSYIDEVAIWRGYFLTEAEAIADRNGGTGVNFAGTSNQDKLLAYWSNDAFFTTTPFKTLRSEINEFDLVANTPYGGVDFPEGTGEIVAGKIVNALEMWGEWDIVGATSKQGSSFILAADPDDQFDFGAVD